MGIVFLIVWEHVEVEPGREDYEKGQIPGSAYVAPGEDLSDPARPELMFAMPPAAPFGAVRSGAGVGRGAGVWVGGGGGAPRGSGGGVGGRAWGGGGSVAALGSSLMPPDPSLTRSQTWRVS